MGLACGAPCYATPNYVRIVNETSALRRLQLDHPSKISQQVFYWTENRLHEMEHAERIRKAIKKWGEEREAAGHPPTDLWNHYSEEEDDPTVR